MSETSDGAAATPLLTVLLVEPDTTIAQLLTLALVEEGFAVETVAAPHDALAMLAARDPDAFAAVLSAPCAPPREPYAWLARLQAWTRAPIVIRAKNAARYADHRTRGYAAVVEEPCDLQDFVDAVVSLYPTAAV
jgi:DNA-binding response OmpR family regulator